MTVWKVDGPLVLAKTVKTGIYPGDTWSGPTGHLDARALRGRLAGRVTLRRCAAVPGREHGDGLDRRGMSVVLPNRLTTLRVPLVPRRGRCSAAFDVSPTAIPSRVIPGSTDDRVLGAHFNAFAYEP